MINHKPYVFLDIETTGLSFRTGGRVLEVGALRVENHQVVGKINKVIDPESSLSYFTTNLTGITDSDVYGAPKFDEIVPELTQLCEGAIFIAHNVNFDYTFIQDEYRKLGASFSMPKLCTVQLSRRLFPEHKSHALGRIIERQGYAVDRRHRAFDDAEVLYKFYMDLYGLHGDQLFAHMSKLLR
jgi:DNA polymerase-3 subunit epsilon